MRILENLTGITILLAWVGAVAMALLVAVVMAMVWRAQAEPPPELRAYGRPAELRPVLLSCVLAVVVMSLWPPTAFALGGALIEVTLATQRRSQPGAPAVELPVEGVAFLAGWRLLGWTAIGLLPSALPEMLVGRDGIAGLSGLVWVGLALGMWAALRGGPTPFPLLAELAWVSLRADAAAAPAPVVKPVTARARANQEHIEALAAEAAAPRVVVENADFAADAREAAAQLARAAIAAQLAAMGLSAASDDTGDSEDAADPSSAGEEPEDLAALDGDQPEIIVVKGRRRSDSDVAEGPAVVAPGEAVATETAATEPGPTEPASTGPALTEPAASEANPIRVEAVDPALRQPAATRLVSTDPAATDPATTEPASERAETSGEPPLSEPATSPSGAEALAQPASLVPRASDPTEAPARPGSLAQAELEDTSEADLPG